MNEKQKKRDLINIFAVILFDITSFGMIIPLTPILAREFGAGGLQVGLIISAYSVVQFLVAPFWGRLSDLFGRKMIILIGLCGSSVAHLFFAFSDSFLDIFFSRILAGFFGANVVIATAYIADVTSLQNRTKNMGLIGMAFGMGFTIGPLIGFLFILLGEKLGLHPPFGAHFASIGSASFCLINGLLSSLFLKESFLIKSQKSSKSKSLMSLLSGFDNSSLFKRPSVYRVWQALRTPKLGLVLLMSFILWFSLAQIEPVLILLVQDDFRWSQKMAYSSFIYIGLLMVLSQGYFVRRWIPKWGESLVNKRGLLIMSLGLIAIALSGWFVLPDSYILKSLFFLIEGESNSKDLFLSAFPLAYFLAVLFLVVGVTMFSIGYSLSSTSLNGAISLLTSEKNQGSIFGVNQSLSALARIVGPAMGGWFYQSLSHKSPFFIAGLLALVAFFLSAYFKDTVPDKGKLGGKI